MTSGVYLLHFDRPLAHARHYIGWSDDINARIECHRLGGCASSSLMRAVKEAGIGFVVARVWPDADRNFERRLKKQKNGCKLCPVCREEQQS